MQARRATGADHELLASIVLHPEVHATNGRGAFDPEKYTSEPFSFAVIVEGGCFLADAIEHAAYAIHTNMLPTARGAQALRAARNALAFAFTSTDAEVLYTRVAADHRAALWFAHGMGFRDVYRAGGSQFMRLDIDDWIVGDIGCREAGADFHRAIGEHDLLTHEDDPVHDAFVGAARGMLEALQYPKAERIYGRWARQAGYEPMEFISADPVLLDIGNAVLRIDGQKFTVIEEK